MFTVDKINEIIQVMDGRFGYYSNLWSNSHVKKSKKIYFVTEESHIDY